MTPFVRRWLDRARDLGLPWWQHLALVLAAALLSLMGEEVWAAVRSIEWTVEPGPSPLSDGGVAEDRDLPPAATDPAVSGRPSERESGSGG